MAKKTYKITGMDCDSCAKMIELDLEDSGIRASCSYAKQILEVDLSNKDEEKKVKDIITNSGYSIS